MEPQRNLLIRKDFNWNQFTFNSFESTFNGFFFEPQRNLMIRKDFNWNQLTFNSFESTFNGFSFWTSKKSIDKTGLQLKSIYFQFVWIYFRWIFLLSLKENFNGTNGFQLKSPYFQFIWIYFQLLFRWNLETKTAPKVLVHKKVPSKQLHSWGSGSLMGYPLEKLFGCWFLIRV